MSERAKEVSESGTAARVSCAPPSPLNQFSLFPYSPSFQLLPCPTPSGAVPSARLLLCTYLDRLLPHSILHLLTCILFYCSYAPPFPQRLSLPLELKVTHP